MRRAERRKGARGFNRIGGQILWRKGFVPDPVHKGRIGAVFQKPAHQIGEQGLVRADRRIDAARASEPVIAHHLDIEGLAHAMQALEFVVAKGEVRPRQMENRRHGLGVVGGELGEDHVPRDQKASGAGYIGDIGMGLPREDRKIRQTVHLSALDLAVPIGALDEPHHQAALAAARQIDDPVDDEGTALAIGLNHKAEPLPSGEVRVEGKAFQNVEAEFEAVGLFGVDIKADVIAPG